MGTTGPDVVIREVGPRDGLQSIGGVVVPPDQRISLVEALVRTGFQRMEAGAFVSPRAVPQMADSDIVFGKVDRSADCKLEALVVNAAGATRAIDAQVDGLVIPVAASETFSQKNVRMSVDAAITEAGTIAKIGRGGGIPSSVDVATTFGCAYEGRVPDEQVLMVVERLLDAGITEIVLADTTGMAAPGDVGRIVKSVRKLCGDDFALGLHFHNTRGLGLVNIQAGLDAGIRYFDASIAGLGGCPFSPGATGNVCTEDVVHFLALLGLDTGIDLPMLLEVARDTERMLDMTLPGAVMKAGPSWQLA